jgi:molecular chaperone Hsp33
MTMNENFVLPFQLETSNVRGRIVRLNNVLHDILSAHDYPDAVTVLTAEITTLSALLSSMLKFEGIFTLQVQSEGKVRMLVSDVTSAGDIRACATFDRDVLKQAGDHKVNMDNGYMAFTVDQGEFTERYQGIVELKPEGLVSSVQHYFSQSEQIPTGIMMAVGCVDGVWRGCAVMLQKMPDETDVYNKDEKPSDEEDDWRRAMILLSSLKNEEMLSSEISAEDILYRLFHEEGVRVYSPQTLQKVCRCSNDRVKVVLSGMPKEDIQDMMVDGNITMTCEFCSTNYIFNPDDFQKGDKT